MLTSQLSFLPEDRNKGSVDGVVAPMSSLTSNRRAMTKTLAPGPVTDKYPIIIGERLSLQHLSACYRQCLYGWRYQYVDVINELLEHDPTTRGVIRQRLLPVAGATLTVTPATLPEGDKDEELAKTIADEVQRQLDNLPSRAQTFGQLAWGSIYGVSGAEVEWERTPDADIKWEVRRLHNIHSRRLNYTAPLSWDVYIYDQGGFTPDQKPGETTGPFGLRVADFPGKFVIHTPALNGDYPTRDGEARYIGFYLAIKRMLVRLTAQDFERTIRPWVVGTYNRDNPDGPEGSDPIADDTDRAVAQQVLDAFGTGSMNSALVPNSVKFDLLKAKSELSSVEFLKWIDEQIITGILGQTFTTRPGAHGNKNAADTAKQGTLEVQRYEAQCFADTLERDLVWWIVALNWGTDVAKRLTPRLTARVDSKPSPRELAEIAKLLTMQDVPLDADALGDRCGYKLTPPGPVMELDEETGEMVETGEPPPPRRTRMVGTTGQPPSPSEEVEPTGQGDMPDPDADGAEDEAPDTDPSEDGTLDMPKPSSKNADPTGNPTGSGSGAAKTTTTTGKPKKDKQSTKKGKGK